MSGSEIGASVGPLVSGPKKESRSRPPWAERSRCSLLLHIGIARALQPLAPAVVAAHADALPSRILEADERGVGRHQRLQLGGEDRSRLHLTSAQWARER
eukprot:5537850-Prymnesium_polylepis.1